MLNMLNELDDIIESEDSLFCSYNANVKLDYFDIIFTTKDRYDDGEPLTIKVTATFEEIRTIPNLADEIYTRAKEELQDMLN